MIKADNVTYEYRLSDEDDACDAKKALCNIQFDIKHGEFVSIVGHNGSGKSTLARLLNAFLKPTGGTMWIDGLDTSKDDNLLAIRQNVGMVFQNPDNQIVGNTVEEDVAFGPENLGVTTDKIWKRVETCLAAVGMLKCRYMNPNKLSGGQKQRSAIAGVLAMRPKCIVLDEPTAMLDPKGRKEVIDAITKLNKEEHINVILITHYMEETIHSDRIYVMDSGRIVMTGSPEQIFSRVEELKSYRLTVPTITYIAHKLRLSGFDIREPVLDVDELIDILSVMHGGEDICL